MRRITPIVAIVSIFSSAVTAQVASAPPKLASLVEISGEIQSLSRLASASVVQVVVTGYASLEPGSAHQVSTFGKQESTGSGVIVDPFGYIVTNAHVVRGAISTKVVLAQGASGNHAESGDNDPEIVDASIIGVDAESDLAVVKIEKKGLPALKFMNSDQLGQGDLVLAIGAPLGLRNSVSLGVVSASARSLSDDNPMVYIQTDASINPGNSGGALVSMRGMLAGLNTFILSQSGGNEGIGFAIPANTVKDVYLQLRKSGQVRRGEIGMMAQNITPAMAKGLSLAREHGVVVADVDPEGPAVRAGVKRADVILSLDGQRMQSANQLKSHIFRRQAGETVQIEALRGATPLFMTLSVREHPDADKANLLARLVHPEKNLVARLGILCIEIDKNLVAMIPGLRREYGLIVAGKSAGGQSQFIDLQPGDIIDAVNTFPVPFLDTLRNALDVMKQGDPVVLQIERDGHFQYLAFELDR